jgi:RNA polymerase sigma-70 factor (ECF subfamily)
MPWPLKASQRGPHSGEVNNGPPVADVASLTRAIVEGNDDAFNQFYDLYSGRLYAFALFLTRGQVDMAQDLLQITMIKVARKFKVFESDQHLWAWLSRCAKNAHIDLIRKQARSSALFGDVRPFVGDVSTTEPLLAWLEEAIAELREDERTLLTAAYFDGQGHAELADTAHTSRKSIECKLARIRGKLRASILRRMAGGEL